MQNFGPIIHSIFKKVSTTKDSAKVLTKITEVCDDFYNLDLLTQE